MAIYTEHLPPVGLDNPVITAYSSHGRSVTIEHSSKVSGLSAHLEAVRALIDQQQWHDFLVPPLVAYYRCDGNGKTVVMDYKKQTHGYKFTFDQIHNDIDRG